MEYTFWILFFVLTVIPMVQLLPHFSIHSGWAAVCVVPLGTVILLWMMAANLRKLEEG